ncbi:MAG: GntR family transcriptional regulator [Caulobacteraceae bacterium]
MNPASTPPKAPAGPDVEKVVAELRHWIHQGVFVPGQRLVEGDLVASLGVSRGRVREAFRRLESEGLIEIEKNRGASVRRISRKEVENTIEVMEAVSLLMADKTIDRRDDPAVRAVLLDSLEKVRAFHNHLTELEQSRQFMDENARFWDVLAVVNDNPVLAEVRMRLETTLFRLALEGARITSQKDKWITRHEEILEAVLAGDRALTRTLVSESVRDVRDAMLALPDGAFR